MTGGTTISIRIVTYQPSTRYGYNFDRDGDDRLRPVEREEIDRLVSSLEEIGGFSVEHQCWFGSIGHRATIVGKVGSAKSPAEGRASVRVSFVLLNRSDLQKHLNNDPWRLLESGIPWDQAGEHEVTVDPSSSSPDLDQRFASAISDAAQSLRRTDSNFSVIIRAEGGASGSPLDLVMRAVVASCEGGNQITFITPLPEPVAGFRLQGMKGSCDSPRVLLWPVLHGTESGTPRKWLGLVAAAAAFVILGLGVWHAQEKKWAGPLGDWGNKPQEVRAEIERLQRWPSDLGLRLGKNDWESPKQVGAHLDGLDADIRLLRNELNEKKKQVESQSVELKNWRDSTEAATPDEAQRIRDRLYSENLELMADSSPTQQRQANLRTLLNEARDLLKVNNGTPQWMADSARWITGAEQWVRRYDELTENELMEEEPLGER